jgi:hypothetical protein
MLIFYEKMLYMLINESLAWNDNILVLQTCILTWIII